MIRVPSDNLSAASFVPPHVRSREKGFLLMIKLISTLAVSPPIGKNLSISRFVGRQAGGASYPGGVPVRRRFVRGAGRNRSRKAQDRRVSLPPFQPVRQTSGPRWHDSRLFAGALVGTRQSEFCQKWSLHRRREDCYYHPVRLQWWTSQDQSEPGIQA